MSEDRSASAKKKKTISRVWNFYKPERESVLRVRKECPRCGKGVFLAEHSDRFSCGKCGYTEFRKKE